jgi:cell division protease FtsH
MELIDDEVARILHVAAQDAEKLLVDHRELLEKLTQALLASEELTEQEIQELIGPSVHE